MKNLTRIFFASLILLLPISFVQAGNLPKIISDPEVIKNTYLPDFSYAGYHHGEKNIPLSSGTIVDVTDYGVIPNDGKDDSLAFLEALKIARDTKDDVVLLLPKGQIILSEIIRISRSNIVIRGAGSGNDGTVLYFPRPLAMIDKTDKLDELRIYLDKYDKFQKEKDHNINTRFSEYSWSGGFIWVQKDNTRAAAYLPSYDPKIKVLAKATKGERGTQTITVSSARKLTVGDVIELQWFNKKGETGPLLNELYGDTDLKIGSHHWTFKKRPLIRQKTRILKVDGIEVTISDPLLHNISKRVPAQFAVWDHLKEVGFEDFKIKFPNSPAFGHHLEQGYNGLYITSVFNGWARDIEFENADSGILTYNSANLTIENIRTIGKRRAHYSVHIDNVHNVLVRNLQVNAPARHSLSLNTQSTKCVFQNSTVWKAAVLDQHAGANHQNLFDNTLLYVDAKRDENDDAYYEVWNGSGAGYWQPGHGIFNTTWNLKVIVNSGAARGEDVTLWGKAEGPEARIIGVSGNRNFTLDYVPAPYLENINKTMDETPSLYNYQLQKRLQQ